MERVLVLPVPDKDNCFVCVSGQKRKQEAYGSKFYGKNAPHQEFDSYSSNEFRTKPVLTFVYRANGVAAEWDGAYGPIQLWFECDGPASDEVKEHWLFPFVRKDNLSWSQLAVTEARLPQAFNHGDYQAIFSELATWVRLHSREKSND